MVFTNSLSLRMLLNTPPTQSGNGTTGVAGKLPVLSATLPEDHLVD